MYHLVGRYTEHVLHCIFYDALSECFTFTRSLPCLLTDHKRPMVVLLLQAHRVHGHVFLHPTEELSSDHVPPHLPPR